MKRYLVPFEGSTLSKAALRYAIQLCSSLPGMIEIVYIADERLLVNPLFDLTVLALQGIGTLGDFLPREKAKLELQAKLITRGEDLLEEVAKWPELNPEAEQAVQFRTNVVSGNPPKYLAEESENYDLVFLGLWGETHKEKMGLWGGTSEVVIRKGTSPIFLATSEYRPIKSVIVAFDNRPRSRQALAWAGMIGENMGIGVTVLSCSTDVEWREEVLGEAREIAESYDTEFNYRQTETRPAKALAEMCKEQVDSLICMGAFGDQPIRELFLGSVAEEVLRQSKSPVLLLK